MTPQMGVYTKADADADIAVHAAIGDAHAQGGHIFILGSNYNSIGQGTWANLYETQQVLQFRFYNSTSADGDNISYKVYLPKGTYTLLAYAVGGGNGAILDFDIDDVEVASWDQLEAGTTYNITKTQTGIVIATSGLKTLKARIDGKSGGGGYDCSISFIALWRTA